MADDQHHFVAAATYPPAPSAYDHTMNISLAEPSNHLTDHPSQPQSALYTIPGHPSDHLNFAHPAANPFAHQRHSGAFSAGGHSADSHVDHANHTLALNPAQLSSNIGPSRVLTRRQARAAQQQAAQQDGCVPIQGQPLANSLQSGPSAEHTYFLPTEAPCPRTPSVFPSARPRYTEQAALGVSTHGMPIPRSATSPPNPSTPASTSSSFSHYGFHPYATHSRSTSSSTDPRSNSPAMSVMSVATSMSSCSSGRFPPPPVPEAMSPIDSRIKQKKQRLLNQDRKAICVYSQENPNARQEDIALTWGVERSTISKILKHKTKWLSIPAGEELRVAKHRPSKFPEIEMRLHAWLVECKKDNNPITDAMIRSKAKDAAKDLDIGEDKFKASAGWVENFKHRHGVRKGVWTGDGRNSRMMALGCMRPPGGGDDEEDEQLSAVGEKEGTEKPDSSRRGDMGPPDPPDIMMGVDGERSGHHTPSNGSGIGLAPSPVPRTQWGDATSREHERPIMNDAGCYEEQLALTPDGPPEPRTAEEIERAAKHVQQHLEMQGRLQLQEQQRQQEQEQLEKAQQLEQSEREMLQHSSAEAAGMSAQSMDMSHAMQFHPPAAYQTLSDADAHGHALVQPYEEEHKYEPEVVTAQDASDAMDKVLTFVNSQPEGYVSPDERAALTDLKQLLFLSAHDLPDSRARPTSVVQRGSNGAWSG